MDSLDGLPVARTLIYLPVTFKFDNITYALTDSAPPKDFDAAMLISIITGYSSGVQRDRLADRFYLGSNIFDSISVGDIEYQLTGSHDRANHKHDEKELPDTGLENSAPYIGHAQDHSQYLGLVAVEKIVVLMSYFHKLNISSVQLRFE